MLATIHRYLTLILGVLAVALVLWCLFLRHDVARADLRADAERARAQVLAEQILRADQIIREERKRAEAMTVIAAQYERDKADAEESAERVIADLRAGVVRLRDEWAGCATDGLSATAAAARRADELAELRERAAAEVVSVGARADAHVRALQQIVRSDREPSRAQGEH